MKTLLKITAWFLVVFVFKLSACKKEDDASNTNPLREAAVTEYTTNYLRSEVADAQWNGSVTGCIAGTLPQEVQDKVLQRINYFRKAVGIAPVTFTTARNQKCQQAALITLANQVSNHTPPSTAICWTPEGYDGCFVSNLYYTRHTTHAVDGFIEDFGATNQATWHRHYILLPQTTKMGHGSTNYSDALSVTEDYYDPLPDSLPAFIGWPPKNYVAAPLVFDRWSFDVPVGGYDDLPDYSNATVTMTDGNGNSVSLSVIYRDERLVWEPDNIDTAHANDVTYHVSIGAVVVDGTSMSYSYDVIIFKP